MEQKASVNLKRRAFLTGNWQEKSKTEVSTACLNHKGIYCQSCKDSCDEQAIVFSQIKMGVQLPVIDSGKCTHCGDCLKVCPVDAITISAVKGANHAP